jgi:hypothetical protein
MLGCCIPRDSSKQTNKMINEALERDRKEMNAESKLLLLGNNNIKFIFFINSIEKKENIKFFSLLFR